MRKACHAQEDDGGGGTIDGADNDNGNGQMEKGATAHQRLLFSPGLIRRFQLLILFVPLLNR